MYGTSTDDDRARRWALVWAHRDRMLAVARARVASREDAEDVVAEAMLRAVEYERLDESRVGAFLCAVVMRLAVDGHRHRGRHDRACVRLHSATDAATDPFEESVCEREEARWLVQALADVRGRERQILEARANGRSVAEAAAELGISAKAAENAWTRVRGKAVKVLATSAGAVAAFLRGLRRAAPAAPVAIALAVAGGAVLAPGAPREADAAAAESPEEALAGRPPRTPAVPPPPAAALAPPPTATRTAPRPAVPAPPTPPREVVAGVGGAAMPAGVARVGGTRVTREHPDETPVESLLRCVENVRVEDPLADPCDYEDGSGGAARPGA